jgi:hypothetical protein
LSTTKARVALNFFALPCAACAETEAPAVSETIASASEATAVARIARRDFPENRLGEAAVFTERDFLIRSSLPTSP